MRGLNLPKKRSITVPASLLKRFVSYFIDFFILNIILIPLRNTLELAIPSEGGLAQAMSFLQTNPAAGKILLFHSLVSGLVILLYFTYFEFKIQQTPGKMLMKIHIIPQGKTKLTFWHYLISNLTFIPTFPFIILWIIDPIYMIFSKQNQRFMEKITNILVVGKFEVY